MATESRVLITPAHRDRLRRIRRILPRDDGLKNHATTERQRGTLCPHKISSWDAHELMPRLAREFFISVLAYLQAGALNPTEATPRHSQQKAWRLTND